MARTPSHASEARSCRKVCSTEASGPAPRCVTASVGSAAGNSFLEATILMPEPTVPLLFVDGNHVMAFESVEELASWLEPTDVIAGGSSAYDADGRLLKLSVAGGEGRSDRGPKLGEGARVAVKLAEAEPQHSDILREALKRFLSATGRGESIEGEQSLPALIAALRSKSSQ